MVGIIANPAASKDIRRLVAQGRVVPDWEKVNIVRRVMLGLQSVGVTSVLGMADSSNLVYRASEDPKLSIDLDFVDMPAFYSCLLYTSPSPRDATLSRMPSSA